MMKDIVIGLIGLVIGAAGMWFVQGEKPTLAKGESSDVAAHAETIQDKPAYLVVLGDVYDREAFGSEYVAKLPPIYAKYGGEYVAVGRNFEVMEGEGDFQAFVISKWPTMGAARSFWNSDEYTPIRDARIENNWGRFDVYLLEGLAAPTSTSPAAQ